MSDPKGFYTGMSPHVTDAWIFVSIGDAARRSGSATLREVISAADANYHAIPTDEQLETSVSRLVAAGLVDAHGRFLGLTPEGRERYTEAWDSRVGNIDRVLNLGDKWEREGYPAPAPRSWSIPLDLM